MLGELDPRQIEQVLQKNVIGRIGCHAGGETYVVPVTYAYEDGCVYAHSAVGKKVQMMRENPRVCFEVDEMDNLSNWRSVVAWGTYEELHGDDVNMGMQTLIRRLMPLLASETSQPSHGMAPGDNPHAADVGSRVPVIFRLRLAERTGRFERRG